MNEPATGAQQIASAHQKLKINMSLTEFEQFLDGSVAAPDGERPDDWIALLAPGADEDTRRGLSAALASRAADVKRQVRPPIAARLAALRKELASQGLAGFLIPRADEHQGEYVPKRAERLAWIANFTGSAGLAIVLRDKAAIFVDGRYTIQVREQVDAQLFEIRHLINEPPEAWIAANLKKGEVLGFDPWLTTPDAAQRYREAARKAGAELKAVDRNPLDAAWTDQPPEPIAPIWPQATEPCRPQRRREARADRQEAEGAGPGRGGDLGARFARLAAQHPRRRRAAHAVRARLRRDRQGRQGRPLHRPAQADGGGARPSRQRGRGAAEDRLPARARRARQVRRHRRRRWDDGGRRDL